VPLTTGSPRRSTTVTRVRTGDGGAPTASARVRHLGADDRSSQRVRIVDATLACVASQGLTKTTLDDIAGWTGLSRATVYRAFPGGREAVLAAVVDTERARLCSELAVAMGEARDLEEALVAGIVGAATRLCAHRAVGYLLEHEPGVLLPHMAFDGMNRVLEVASSFAAPFLARWLEPDQAARSAEWAVRITFSYLSKQPTPFDVTDTADVERLVSRFVLPGVLALRAAAGGAAPPRRPGPDRTSVTTRPGHERIEEPNTEQRTTTHERTE
jgi:AcrR family transcriptional regulator